MSDIKKDKKNKKSKKALKIFIIIIFIYMGVRSLPTTFSSTKTLTPVKEELLDTIRTKGVIIKKESVYLTNNDGVVEKFQEEGRRVKTGTKIATLTSSSDSSAIEGELHQVEQSLRELEEMSVNIIETNKDLTKDELKSKLVFDIQNSIKNDEIEDIYILKEQLMNIENNNKDNISKLDLKLELENKKTSLTEAMNKGLSQYYSEFGGLVSYKVDGYEEKYLPEDFERYTYDKVKKDLESYKDGGVTNSEEKKYEAKINEPVCKVIDNFEWYIGILIDDLKLIDNLKDNRSLTIKIADDNDNMTGKVITINKFKNTGLIVLKFTSRLHDFYNIRFTDIEIMKSNKIGYKVPKDAIINKGKEKGVYIKDLSGIIRFRPIEIIGEDEKNVFAKSGDDSGNLRINDEDTVKTITIYDEIILKPKNVREGSILK